MPQVEYIGRKDSKADNVANSGTVWCGNGDVQTVSDEVWAMLAPYDSIWRLAPDPQAADIGTTSDAPAIAVGKPGKASGKAKKA